MIFGFAFGAKLLDRIDCRVNLPAKSLFRLAETRNNVVEPDFADNHQIDVTRSTLLLPCDRAVNEGQSNAIRERHQRILDQVVNSNRLRQNALEFGKDRVVLVCLIIHLVPAADAPHDPNIRELLQFPLGGSKGRSCLANKVPQIKLLIRMAIEQSENRASALAEQDVGETG